MNIFLGIDGGGTRTRAVACDETGAVTAWAASGATNPNHVPETEVVANLAEAARAACSQLGAQPSSVASVFLGMAGITEAAGRERLSQLAARAGLGQARIGVDHDIHVALAGGLAGRPGIALIVGTGSSCYGRDAAGRSWQTGGWEYLVADEGSGFFLGREAITAAVRMADGRLPETALRNRIFELLNIGESSEIIPRLHRPLIAKPEVASLAPRVIDLAEAGDTVALDILERGAGLLSEMVAANHRCLPTGPGPEVIVTGGLGTADRLYRRLIFAAIQRALPKASVGLPQFPPAVGAVLLAMQQAGRSPTPALLVNLSRQTS